MNISLIALSIFTVAAVTAFTRGAPYLLFGRRETLPRWVTYLGTYLPCAIMVILVVYCLRGAFPLALSSQSAAQIIAALVVVAVQLLKKNTILSIFLGTACYMILIRTLFIA
ncbi:MAG: AzlD domain-containing protein [Oscillospiraceae bacterium]